MRQRIDAQREAERLVVEVGRLRSDGLRQGEEAKRELAQREQQRCDAEKPPQKPPPHSAERRKSPVPPGSGVGAKSKGDVDLCDVWRQGGYSIGNIL